MADLVSVVTSLSDFIKAGTHHLPYPVYTSTPIGCTLYKLPNECMEPLVTAGATVVVDTADRAIQFGEHFLIQQSRGPCVWQFYKPRGPFGSLRKTSVMLSVRNRGCDQIAGDGRGRFSDGPIYRWALEEIIIGRVIGVFDPCR